MWLKQFFVVALLSMVSGCGNGETVQSVTPPINHAKPVLESIAETGILDSGLMIVQEELEKMKATDAAKAETLLKDLGQLQKLPDATRIKAKAKEMAARL